MPDSGRCIRAAWNVLLAMAISFVLIYLAAVFEVPFLTEAGGRAV